MWTNIVGAALWIADEYEKNERDILQQQQQLPPPSSNQYYPSTLSPDKQWYGSTTV